MADLALLILRLAFGLTYAAHGAQKAFGWWEGPGPTGWRGAIARMGFRPVDLFVVLSVGAELVGGLLAAVGLVTPIAAALLVAQSIVIVGHAHWSKGFFSAKGGFEFPLLLGVTALAICLTGAGAISLDAMLGLPFPAPIRLGLVAVGIFGGIASIAVPRMLPRPRAAEAQAPTPSGKPAGASAAQREPRRRPTQLRRG